MKGLVLAGGESRRYGRDKALAPWTKDSTETYAERAFRTLSAACDDEVWVSCRATQGIAFTKSLILDQSTESEGPAAGLRAAHMKAPEATWFALACDYPLADEACLQYLLKQWKEGMSALVFKSGAHYEPLIGIWTARALSNFKRTPLRGPHSVLEEMGASAVICPNERWLLNANTLNSEKTDRG